MRQIRKNVLYNVLLNVARALFPLITAPYLSRVLEPEGIGLSDFAMYYAGFFAMAALLGIPTHGVREVAKKRGDQAALQDAVNQLFSISALTTVLSTIIYVATLLLVGRFNGNLLLFAVAGITLYLAPIHVDWYFQGMERFRYITLRSLAIKAVSVVCLFLLVRTKADVTIYVLLSALTVVANDLWNIMRMRRDGIRLRLTFKGLKPHMRPVLVLFLSLLAYSVYTMLDREILGFLSGYEQVGYYGRAINVSRTLLAALTSISIVIIPRVAQSAESNNIGDIQDLVGKSVSVVSFFSVPMFVGLACIAPVFVILFYGDMFGGTVVPLMIAGLLIPVVAVSNITTDQILIGMGQDVLFFCSIVCGAVSNVVLNFILIPRYAAVGAAIAAVASEVLVLIAALLSVRFKTRVRFPYRAGDFLKSLAGSALFIPLLLVLKHYLSGWALTIVFVVSGVVVYFAVQLLLRHSAVSLIKSEFKR